MWDPHGCREDRESGKQGWGLSFFPFFVVNPEQWFLTRAVLPSRGHRHSLETFSAIPPRGAAGLRRVAGRVQRHMLQCAGRGAQTSAALTSEDPFERGGPFSFPRAAWGLFRRPHVCPYLAKAVRRSVPVEPVPWATLAPSEGREPLLPTAAMLVVTSHLPVLSPGSTASLPLTRTGLDCDVAASGQEMGPLPARGDSASTSLSGRQALLLEGLERPPTWSVGPEAPEGRKQGGRVKRSGRVTTCTACGRGAEQGQGVACAG